MRSTSGLGLAAVLAAAAGCAGDSVPIAGGLHGIPLPTPMPRPAFVLETVEGTRYDFAAATRGRLTLLFFGYTNCPDVCPATMANLGAVMGRLTSQERGLIDVVFVTTDPERDTPEVLGEWLRHFDRDVVGLTGALEELVAAQRAAGVSPAVRDSGGSERYTVSHAAQVIVISPDDTAHVAYPFGVRQSEWAEDIPQLLTRWGGRRR